MRNLALLNVLWEGGEHVVGRRTSESFTVRGARLSVALLVQPETLREFFAKSGPLVRGIGFLARFLVSWPPSTQGTRFFTEPPEHWPALAAFHRRIAEIIALPVPVDDKGSLAPRVLPLMPEAKAAWIAYHDAVESELGVGGELFDVCDVAARSAENAARLAALFHVFDHGMGPIGPGAFQRASRIAAWHLHEARRFFGELAIPTEMADAARLDDWLIAHCRRERVGTVPTRDAQRLGPVRDKERLGAALQELEELSRVRVIRADRRRLIAINPALLEDGA
jgi:putative DNA primase/helicase